MEFCTADKVVQQFNKTGQLVLKGVSALSRGVLKEKETAILSIAISMFTSYVVMSREAERCLKETIQVQQ